MIAEKHGDLIFFFFGGHPKKKVFMRKYLHKKWSNSFSGKFGKIQAKILHTPKILPVPTPMIQSLCFHK